MSASKRKSVGKRLRFSIFTRDGFACRYCGRQSDEVKLEIDHIMPICKGGTNDEANLVTACGDCNRGKAGSNLAQAAPTEGIRLRIAQEMREQEEAWERARAAAEFRERRKLFLLKFWCHQTGRNHMCRTTFNIIFSYVEAHGEETVMQWIEFATARCGHTDADMGRYISGIRRIFLEEEMANAQEEQANETLEPTATE